MIEVNIPQTNNKKEYEIIFDKAVKRFKKACANDGFMKEIRDRRYYKKPCEKRIEANRKKQKVFKQLKESYKK